MFDNSSSAKLFHLHEHFRHPKHYRKESLNHQNGYKGIPAMKKKLLICDDDQDIVDMLTLTLKDQRFEVLGITRGAQLLPTIESFNPDAVLLDIWMPDFPGDVAVQTLRQTSRYAKLPVIIMSASRDGQEAALRAGATGFVAKPFSIDDILNLLRISLGQ